VPTAENFVGKLKFYDNEDDFLSSNSERPSVIVEPKRGRVAIFSSGPENPHKVDRVESGQRFVLSFWFSCDPKKEFQIFLDGKAHVAFSHIVGKSVNDRKGKQLPK
jgi:hypothetical protein